MSLMHPAKFVAALLAVGFSAPLSLYAANYYVAPTGSDTAAGTEAAPFATVGRGQMAAAAGDTVFIRGGTYTIASTSATIGVAFSKSGTQAAPIKYFAYPGELPIFDLFGLLPNARVTGFDVTASWLHIRGMEIRGTQQIVTGDSWGIRVRGNNNIIEHMNVHHGEAPGIFIAGSAANNLILNCDSHDNYDPLEGGGNGDGFGCHATGGGNIIRGCRGYRNSDDGYDFISASGSCTVEKSWAWGNGWQYTSGSPVSAGNGAGFKAGGYGSPPSTSNGATHTVRQCVAFGNKAQGFYANHHPGRINFHNNTAFNNPANFNMLADSGYPSDHEIRNNIAMTTGSTISNLTGGTATFNSWNLSVTVSAADFVNVTQAEAEAPRLADGSLPNVGFMRLVAGSDLIDKGTDVGLPFVGTAPDLGAFEFGAVVTGTGGAMGTGGATGTGGVTGTGGGAGGRVGTGGVTGSGGGGGRGGTGVVGTGGSVVTGTGGSVVTGTGGSVVTGTGGGVVTGTGGSVVTGTGGSVVTGTGGSVVAGTGGVVGGGTGGSTIGAGGASMPGGPGVIEDTPACGCRSSGGQGDLAGSALFVVLISAGWYRRRRNTRSS